MPGGRTTTKADLTNKLSNQLGLPKTDCRDIVNVQFELIAMFLEAGLNVKVSCFGNFYIRKKNPRIGRNPKTMKEAIISGRYVVSYRPSQKVIDRLGKNSQYLDGLLAN